MQRLDFLVSIGAAALVGATATPCYRANGISRQTFAKTYCYTVTLNGKTKAYMIGRYEPEKVARIVAALVNRDFPGYSAVARSRYVTLTANL